MAKTKSELRSERLSAMENDIEKRFDELARQFPQRSMTDIMTEAVIAANDANLETLLARIYGRQPYGSDAVMYGAPTAKKKIQKK